MLEYIKKICREFCIICFGKSPSEKAVDDCARSHVSLSQFCSSILLTFLRSEIETASDSISAINSADVGAGRAPGHKTAEKRLKRLLQHKCIYNSQINSNTNLNENLFRAKPFLCDRNHLQSSWESFSLWIDVQLEITDWNKFSSIKMLK